MWRTVAPYPEMKVQTEAAGGYSLGVFEQQRRLLNFPGR